MRRARSARRPSHPRTITADVSSASRCTAPIGTGAPRRPEKVVIADRLREVGHGGIPNEVAKQHVDERSAKARRRDEQWHFAAGDGVANGARVLRPFGLL